MILTRENRSTWIETRPTTTSSTIYSVSPSLGSKASLRDVHLHYISKRNSSLNVKVFCVLCCRKHKKWLDKLHKRILTQHFLWKGHEYEIPKGTAQKTQSGPFIINVDRHIRRHIQEAVNELNIQSVLNEWDIQDVLNEWNIQDILNLSLKVSMEDVKKTAISFRTPYPSTPLLQPFTLPRICMYLDLQGNIKSNAVTLHAAALGRTKYHLKKYVG